MSRITQRTIDLIFETARIEEVIGDFVQLKRSGSNFKGLSPFNNEKSPSFMVSPAKQIFKDFSSGKGGSVVTFLMEHEHFTYPEALRWLAKRYTIEIEEDEQQTDDQAKAENEREAVYLVTKFAQEWFAAQLQTDEGKGIGLSYFTERGFTAETVATFGLGYAPQQRDAVATAALAKGYSEEVLLASGICLKREDGSWYDRFWGRVIFPIYSQAGRVLGFGGRVLKTDAKTAKYLNSPENPIYHKSNVLYGLFQSRKSIIKNDEAFLVEGYTDVISLFQAGVENVVASSGTALTEEQIRLLKRFTNNVTILYDGDPAGIRASFRGIDMFLAEGVNVRVVLFTEGDDPDSYVRKHSGIEFKEFVAEYKTDFIRFKADLLVRDTAGDPIKKAEAIRDIVTSIGKISDEIKLDVFVKECASILDMDVKVLYAELNKIRGKELREATKKGAQPTLKVVEQQPANDLIKSASENSQHFPQEKALIELLVFHGNKLIALPGEIESDASQEVTVGLYLVHSLGEDDIVLNNSRFQRVLIQCRENLMQDDRVPEVESYTRQEDREMASLPSDLMDVHHLSRRWSEKTSFTKWPETVLSKHTWQVLHHFKNQALQKKMQMLNDKLKTTSSELENSELMWEVKKLTEINKALGQALGRVV
jgi:DNA primase